ncbi:MAG TPA: hypothetical protein VFB59_02550, partial [Candidatus Saccharimonadales bacterium]|nr:hypothetical protein [Candidatus Saccharimonadales bacterium]
SLAALVLSGFLLCTSKILEESAKFDSRAAIISTEEFKTDRTIDQNCKADDTCILSTGITKGSNADQLTRQAIVSSDVAGVLHNSGKAGIACSLLGLIISGGGVALRRRHEATASRNHTQQLVAARTRRRLKPMFLPIVPYQKPAAPTMEDVHNEVGSLRSLVNGIEGTIALSKEELERDAYTRRMERLELCRQATIAGFAALREEWGMAPYGEDMQVEANTDAIPAASPQFAAVPAYA